MAKPLPLEFRISSAHIGRDGVATPRVRLHNHNPFWSYARHLPANWDNSKIGLRTAVACRLLENLRRAGTDGKMDLSPLLDDHRASGIVYGCRPLQNMYGIIRELARQNPSYPFFGKWGGHRPELPGKRFVFYVENAADAEQMIVKLKAISHQKGIEMNVEHQLGISTYSNFVTIDAGLKSEVRDIWGFTNLLESLLSYPHFLHELF